jgi:hypothetical protein
MCVENKHKISVFPLTRVNLHSQCLLADVSSRAGRSPNPGLGYDGAEREASLAENRCFHQCIILYITSALQLL